jgi:glycosyltransferase involved in cell wall biosynthesis
MSDGMRAYTRELVQRLPKIAADLRIETFSSGDNFDVREQIGIPLEIARRRPKLVHFLTPFTPFLIPAKYIVTIHDLIDLHFPQFGKAKVQPYYRLFVRSVLHRASRIITDDPRTRDDLQRLLGIAPANVAVIPLGLEETFGDVAAEEAARPYFLYVGNQRPHKDLGTLFAAWHGLPAGSGFDLYLTGDDDFGERLAPYRRDDAQIVFLGTISRERLARLYRGARAYVHPSLLEGFGFPMLEAMWCATPVIATAESVPEPLREHAIAYPARDVVALRSLLSQAIREPDAMQRYGAAAQAVARSLTWDRTVRATLDVYREVLDA